VWRRLHVDGEDLRWTVSVATSKPAHELGSIRVTLIVRGPSRRIEAVFHGFAVEDLWYGRQQNLTITPRVVADVVHLARTHGARIDHAERLLPAAVTSADPADTALAAACSEWFVPYPGRSALIEALADSGRDYTRIAERFSTPTVRLSAAQIERWVTSLGI
jgi:hypothetical protein